MLRVPCHISQGNERKETFYKEVELVTLSSYLINNGFLYNNKNHKQFYNINSKVTYHLIGVFLLDVYPLLAKKANYMKKKKKKKILTGLKCFSLQIRYILPLPGNEFSWQAMVN